MHCISGRGQDSPLVSVFDSQSQPQGTGLPVAVLEQDALTSYLLLHDLYDLTSTELN